MLKKLVKYGNSNALVLDKPILELLNIHEGSVVKITTDGTSIIITPHVIEQEVVHEPFTHEQANFEIALQEFFKSYKGLSDERRTTLEKEFRDLMNAHKELSQKIYSTPKFMSALKKLDVLKNKRGKEYPVEYTQAYSQLRKEYATPELLELEHLMNTFQSRHKLSNADSDVAQLPTDLIDAMGQEMGAVYAQHQEIFNRYNHMLNDPEYMHQAQLLAEEYATHKNADAYSAGMTNLIRAHCPGFIEAQEELKAIEEKYRALGAK